MENIPSIARKADDFGRPNAFCGNIDESKWESFTLTMTGRTSGRTLETVLRYTEVDGHIYVVASMGGRSRTPAPATPSIALTATDRT